MRFEIQQPIVWFSNRFGGCDGFVESLLVEILSGESLLCFQIEIDRFQMKFVGKFLHPSFVALISRIWVAADTSYLALVSLELLAWMKDGIQGGNTV